MKTIFTILFCSAIILAAKVKDTTTVVNCKCDTLTIVTTYKDTSVILKVDTLKAEKPEKKEKKEKKDKKGK